MRQNPQKSSTRIGKSSIQPRWMNENWTRPLDHAILPLAHLRTRARFCRPKLRRALASFSPRCLSLDRPEPTREFQVTLPVPVPVANLPRILMAIDTLLSASAERPSVDPSLPPSQLVFRSELSCCIAVITMARLYIIVQRIAHLECRI